MSTVDWSNWMNKSPAEQAETWRRYRKIVRDESERAFQDNYRTMWNAIFGAQRAMLAREDEQRRQQRWA